MRCPSCDHATTAPSAGSVPNVARRSPRSARHVARRTWATAQGIPEQERAARYPSLEESMPQCFAQLERTAKRLEKHYRDMQDLEFTIERGWMTHPAVARQGPRRRAPLEFAETPASTPS
jgi:hypothetical protein